MASHRGLYPGYDVLAHKHEWDANTRQIVEKRLGPFSYKLLSKGFLKLGVQDQFQILRDLQLGQLPMVGKWNETLQRALFKKLVSLAVEAYYSHPWVWSEIGYGGPAYPRGYVRIELGLADPWEAQRGGSSIDAEL